MTIQSSKKRLGVIVLLVAVAVVLAVLLLRRPFPRERYEAGYPQISVGDSKEKVVGLFGRPAEIADCRTFTYSGAAEELKDRCAEQYLYHAALGEWTIVFDKSGRVISKSYVFSR